MPNNNYKRGYTLERKVKLYLESIGYLATRAAGSHGLYDVWATNGQHLLFVQGKIGATPAAAKKLVEEMQNEYLSHNSAASIPVVFSVVDGMKGGIPHELARSEYGRKSNKGKKAPPI